MSYLRGRYPSKMAEQVAADIGISAAAVRKLEERASVPSLPVFGRMVAVYGPEFLHAVFGWDWLSADRCAARQVELEAGIARQQAELQQLREVRA